MTWLENLARDARFSLRSLAAAPGFTAVAVLSLGLGIGSATAVFSLVNAILLRSLPVPNPGELRLVQWAGTAVRVRSFDGSAVANGDRWTEAEAVSHPTFVALRAHAASHADVFGFYPVTDAAIEAGGEALVADGAMVSENFFSGLQVRAAIGRLLSRGSDYAGAMSVVIAHDVWQRRFRRDPGVLGGTIAINGAAFTIVGVLEPGFSGVEPGRSCDFYVPLSAASPFLYTSIDADWHWFVRLLARLRPGVTDARLASALDVTFARQAEGVLKEPKVLVEPGQAGLAHDRDRYRKPLVLMLGLVGLVLLTACANLAGLLIARRAAQQRDAAVRAALGASRRRLFQQSITDSLMIAALGGGLGILVASWGRSALASLLLDDRGGTRYDVSLDASVVAFSLAVTFGVAVLAGLLPAMRWTRANPVEALRSRGALGAPRLWTGRALVVAQIALSLLVLASAGLFVRTLVNLTRADAGFGLERLLLVGLNLRGGQHADADPARFYERLEAEVAAIPGVRSAAIVEFPLLAPGGSTGNFSRFVGGPAPLPAMMQVRRLRVGESFFSTIGIPILRGRGPRATDSESAPKVVVVNESFVRTYLPHHDPVGLAFRMWDADWTIVGVCRDAKYDSIKAASPPTAYFPYKQMFYSRFRKTHLRGASVAARTAVAPLTLAAAVRRAVARVDPGVAVTVVTTQEDVRDRTIARERLLAVLCGGLAGFALLLSSIGLFGLMAYNVTRRTGEIGVRIALGAARLNVAGAILGEAFLLAGAGVALGVPLALAFARLVRAQLFAVEPGDPLSMVLSVVVMVATAAAAAWIPARRAQRIEPIEALRYDG